MRTLSPLSSLLAVLVLATGCASQTKLSAGERSKLQHDLTTGPTAERYLKHSSFITPFFGDDSKRLLTPYPPEEVRLLNDTQGHPINPGAVQATVPAGTRVHVTKVEFPSSWVMVERVLYSPRTQPWVYLTVEGVAGPAPVILVLPPGLDKDQDVLTELDRWLLPQDPAPRIARFQPRFQEALKKKQVIDGMPEAAVEMSWGPPERIRRTLEGPQVNQDWTYPGDKRHVFLTDGVVTRAP